MEQNRGMSPMAVALWISGLLLVVVGLLNVRPSEEVFVDITHFQGALEAGKVDSIRVADGIPHVKLREPDTFRQDGRYVRENRIRVHLGPITPAMISDWKSRGIALSFQEREETWVSALSEAVPWLLVIGLAALGVGYMVREAQKSRSGEGTPRERLKALDDRFKAGALSRSQYDEQKDEILSQM